jgi:predicted nucleic acid-binding Zn ribbon protein
MSPKSLDPEPACRTCHTGMVLCGIEPCADGYDMWSYRCANCGGTFTMVAARTADSASHAERRVVARHRVTTSGSIEFGRGQLACMVRNLSAAGAGLDSTGRARIPKRFTLIAGGSHLLCRVIWRREGRIGIAFD